MSGYQDKIRETAQRLLKEGSVELVIGFRKGTLPMMNEPCFIRRPEDVHQLVWDSNCGINLANYLTDRKEKIAVVAKGCDSRNIVTHIIENKVKRENLYIIGVPCQGMTDKQKIVDRFGGDIQGVSEDGDTVSVTVQGAEYKFSQNEAIQENCALCIHRNPVIFDELVGEPVKEQSGIDRYAGVRRREALGSHEKWQYFEDLLSPCIRCYACRNACPLCYCPTCFVDESRPQWVGKSQDPIDIRTFHFLRAYHCAGRCTDCGACERACPMDIKVRQFTSKLNKDALEMFGWEAGLTLDQRPPLDTYKPDDSNDFIK